VISMEKTESTTASGVPERNTTGMKTQESILPPHPRDPDLIWRDGYDFLGLTIHDGIVVRSPWNAPCSSPRRKVSSRSLEEHIEIINIYKTEIAMVIAEDISFITRCPSLKYLTIIPADTAGDAFDYSPLYSMPEVKGLFCDTVYGPKDQYATTIDCARLKGLEGIHAYGPGYENVSQVMTLKNLFLTHYRKKDLTGVSHSPVLNNLVVAKSSIKTLEGIQEPPKMQCVHLLDNRSLADIGALRMVKRTLKKLQIRNCPKITDFSVIGELEHLEHLELAGSNELPDLRFLQTMPNLKTLILLMNVKDGDITPCQKLSYVYLQNRRHYNLKCDDLPKGDYAWGDDGIDPRWRFRY